MVTRQKAIEFFELNAMQRDSVAFLDQNSGFDFCILVRLFMPFAFFLLPIDMWQWFSLRWLIEHEYVHQRLLTKVVLLFRNDGPRSRLFISTAQAQLNETHCFSMSRHICNRRRFLFLSFFSFSYKLLTMEKNSMLESIILHVDVEKERGGEDGY